MACIALGTAFGASNESPVTVAAAQRTGFTSIPPRRSGIAFANNLLPERHLTNQILANGSGVAAGDFDGDGLVDLFFAGLNSASRLYRNAGNFRFEDATIQAGVLCQNLDATGTAFADLDGDGKLDLVINSLGGGTKIFWNNGAGKFKEAEQLLNPGRGGSSLAIADINGDGLLDLYIANYRLESIQDQPGTRFSVKMVNGKPTVNAVNGRSLSDPALRDRFNFSFGMAGGQGRFAHFENGEADVLYRNLGARRFEEVSFTGGSFLDQAGAPLSKPPFDWGLAVMIRDINDDGAPDIYVCNDFDSPDRLWLNNGSGVFRAASQFAIRHLSFSSMAVDFADVNRDGLLDFFTADMLSPDHRRRLTQANLSRNQPDANRENVNSRPQYQQNCLFLNRGDGTYVECAQFAGLDASDWSWASIFLDVDLDGYEDLLITNGFVRDNMNEDVLQKIERLKAEKKLSPAEQLDARRMFPVLNTRNFAFRNLGGVQFEDASAAWGFNEPVISTGMCLADLDNDGDMDVVVNNINAPAMILRNESAAPRVAVRLKGVAPNTRGIGAKITVRGHGIPAQTQEMIAGGRYVSSDDPMRVFAAGSATNKLTIEVRWRSGKTSLIENGSPNHIYSVDETESKETPHLAKAKVVPLFEDVSNLIGHKHALKPFADFERQPSLPHKLDGCGPGVAWHDLDRDGWEDLIVAGGQGNAMAIYLNDRKGGFSKSPRFAETTSRDQSAVLAFYSPNDGANVLQAFSNYHDGVNGPPGIRHISWNAPAAVDLMPAEKWSFGTTTAVDMDGDGDLDLFVAGRVVPGRYPQSAPSRIFENTGNDFKLAQELANIGLVNGAVWTDLTGDARPELVLACEWGPIRVFQRKQNSFEEITASVGLDKFIGKWNGVSVGDFDGDGKLDLVASNWGSNNEFRRYKDRHLKIHFGEIGERAVVIMSAFEPTLGKQAPITAYDQAAKCIPDLAERFPTVAAYAEASVDDVLGADAPKFQSIEATWFETTVFLNHSGRFEAHALPFEAQLAPAFGVCVADVNGDGAEDIFLAQNFFGFDYDKARLDGGRGLILLGDNSGHFEALSGEKSGIITYGEQRAAAACNYDHDGRVDLVFTQRGAETKLYRNTSARPALRVALKNSDANVEGIGATVRLRAGGKLGPAREVHAGGGYMSQDSAQLILGSAEPANSVVVRWPSGKESEYDLPPNAREVELNASGELRLLR
jgi:enediyne biosynthesis protein E4